MVRAIKTGKIIRTVSPADWGPHVDTGRVADLSPGLMKELGIDTDDEVEVTLLDDAEATMPYGSVVISSGHGKYIRGASGILDEVDEAREVVDAVADYLHSAGIEVTTFHDNVSTSQNENLNRIVDFHNEQTRDLDISVHFNAYEDTSKPMGTEVLYVTQSTLAANMSAAISSAGDFIDRGPKKRTDLFFLNNTEQPAILIETCFVDSSADADLYNENFEEICRAIVDVLAGRSTATPDPPHLPDERPPPEPPAEQHVDIVITAPRGVIVNVTQMTTGEPGVKILRKTP
jgi:N-acetylmuramoyl-L-alanine amidase